MQCKSGLEHIQSLRDGRTIYLDGEIVGDVTTHPAYRNAVASAALLYDHQSRPENLVCVPKIRFCNIGDEDRRGQAAM
jgi:aromatic ring hydroxylase